MNDFLVTQLPPIQSNGVRAGLKDSYTWLWSEPQRTVPSAGQREAVRRLVRRMGEGQLADQFQPLADALRADDYDGVISFESVYHPGNGNFEDGFRLCIDRFKEIFG